MRRLSAALAAAGGGLGMDVMKTAERGGSILRAIAHGLTETLVAGRKQIASSVDDASRITRESLDQFREVSEDLLARMSPGPLVEDLYAFLGIASASALADLDERVDYVELKVDEVARKRAREELLLLQQRITELETILSHVGEGERNEAMGALLNRLGELESRIDALPWTRFSEERRMRT